MDTYKSPTPCGDYAFRNGWYSLEYVSEWPNCEVCYWSKDEHDLSRSCSHCKKAITGNEYHVVMADVVGRSVSLEREDAFCDRSCLVGFLKVWGF